ncbi:MAG: phosphatase PAP2 family protein [Methylobacillus sp.]|jgi:membrane-associated phospholipid phosphatase|nr:phosphatase PAP2 family protein [Methylobacillus sp.]
MRLQDYFVNIILSSILIVGAYQFYFFTQRHPIRKARTFHSLIDERIPFWPVWGWVYSFLYYPAILYLNLIVTDARHFTQMAFSFILLLFIQMACFYIYPVETPAHWRNINTGKSASERFLLFVQKFDAPSNCFPSMHVSVAMLTALLAQAALGPWVFAFPLLIGISCIFTKQHYLIDLPTGALLGVAGYEIYLLLL